LEPSYARASYWLAHLSGLNISQTWFWARQADGSIRNNAGKGYAGSNNQQPRIINEVASTVMDLNSNAEAIYAMQQLRKPLRIFYSKTSAINKATHLDDVFDLYEALYFEGTPIGFATKGIIEEQNNSDWEAILIYKTEFVTVAEINILQTYLDNGGTIIIDNISLQQNEYGQNHLLSLSTSNGTIIQVSSIDDIKLQAFGLLSSNSELPNIILDETNALNEDGCFWRTVTNDAGKEVITIVNLGKENTQITLSLRNGETIDAVTNLLTGQATTNTFTMLPEDVLLLEIASETLSINEVALDEFKYYPNPTSDIINFEASRVIEKATVYNILGQEVANLKGQTNSLQVDIASYPQGVYLVKLSIEGQVKTVSIIKK